MIRADVGGVALAEVGDDAVSQLVELAAERFDLVRREVWMCSWHRVRSPCLRWSSDFKRDVAGGDGHAQLDVLVLLAETSPVKTLRTAPRRLAARAGVADAHPAAEVG